MSFKKSIIAFLTSFVLLFFYLNLRAETRLPEIIDLGEGIPAHAIVRDIILANNITVQDVIDTYRSAMSKEENKDVPTIIGRHEKFSIYIEPEDKTIFSVKINRNREEK